jgi:GDP-D-mannose dehydratase
MFTKPKQNICDNCRICNHSGLIDVMNIGEQIITSRFPLYGDYTTPSITMILSLCTNCSLIQLKYSANASELYEYEYGYRSGISNTMRTHLKQYQEEIMLKVASSLNPGDAIVDIGSNDSTMLQYYETSLKRIGVDPTGSQFKEFYRDVELIPTYFTYTNFTEVYNDLYPKVISSISMFYDLPDPVQFAKDIYSVLHDDGIWTCEQSYIITMLERNSIDTICLEHLEYYSLTAVKHIADLANFKIIDIKFNDCNGGSFRIYFAKKQSLLYSEATELIAEILDKERKFDITNPDIYKTFLTNCDKEVHKLNTFIDIITNNCEKMYIYGASTKGNCLLQYAKINETKIKYAVERNPNKIGKMTSTGSLIISEETMRINPPEYLLVLPWHFREEIIQREDEYLENGGQLVFPFPNFEIYSKYPKVLITGCDGMIAKYVIDEYIRNNNNNVKIYGFGHKNENYTNDRVTKIYFDIKNTEELELNMNIIQPNIIIHLASISSSIEAFNYPICALELNGLIVANICNIIHKNGWTTKLFNASSSAIYNGHNNYDVSEDDPNMYHCHPYSIAKIMGHSIVDFYRKTYNLPFSNGILFTIETKYKNDTFLLNKVASHAKKWKTTFEPLVLGTLESYRTILHASDAAKAIKLILDQPQGDTFVICGDEPRKILDLVLQIYNDNGIKMRLVDNAFYNDDNDNDKKKVVIIENNNVGIDIVPNNIRGNAHKLKALGWKPLLSVDNILNEIIR